MFKIRDTTIGILGDCTKRLWYHLEISTGVSIKNLLCVGPVPTGTTMDILCVLWLNLSMNIRQGAKVRGLTPPPK